MNDRVTGIVLAAGLSRRAAPANKLLAPFGAGTVVRSTVVAMSGAGFDELIVVTGHDRERIEKALSGLPVRYVFAARFAEGMGHSLAAGVLDASPTAGGFAVCPGDLPRLTAAQVRLIAGEFIENGGQKHVVPTAGGQRGHPVFLGAWLRGELEHLAGDEGARRLLAQPSEMARCCFLEVRDPAIHADIDQWYGQPGR
jgi:molybdenum cofactor cytidylyltransferase